jgi:hypothetical protein
MLMQKLRSLTVSVLMVLLAAIGVYGCGGETPTATIVPVAPTNLTSPPATATVEAQPTATLAHEQPTATTATSGGANSGDAMSVLKRAADAMKSVTSFHIVMNTSTVSMTLTMEGDVAQPGKMRLAMIGAGIGGTEVLVVDGVMYSKIPGGDTYIQTLAHPSLLGSTTGAEVLPDIAENASVVGDETVDGTSTTHIKFSYDADKALAAFYTAIGQSGTSSFQLGQANADMWVDKSTGYVKQFKVASTVRGTASTTTAVYSKYNEPINPPIEKPTNVMTVPGAPTP